jgi:hypothetical protein
MRSLSYLEIIAARSNKKSFKHNKLVSYNELIKDRFESKAPQPSYA